jgi:phosphate transport system substrate-binding protein
MKETMIIKSYGILVVVSILISIVISGCISGGNIETLKIIGSTTLLPIAQKSAEKYMDAHEKVDIQVSGGGSSVGIQSVAKKTADIGMSSRDLKSSEKSKYPNLKEHCIAKDAIVMIVHPSNPITSLTKEQIKMIYNGTYSNWKQLGGKDYPIVVIGRDSASGTREFFYDHVMNKTDFIKTLYEKNSNGAIKQTVMNNPNAIGYVGLGYIDSTVKVIKIKMDNLTITPTLETVKSGEYPISRNLNFITDGVPTGLAKEFIDYIKSKDGQKIVEAEGFVPLN